MSRSIKVPLVLASPLALAAGLGLLTPTAAAQAGLGTRACDGVPNSTGAAAELSASGSADVSANALQLSVSALPPQSLGLFIVAPDHGPPRPLASGMGELCLSGPVGRFTQAIQNAGPAGAVSFQPNLGTLPQGTGTVAAAAGDRWTFQYWYRDTTSTGAASSNLSSARVVSLHGPCGGDAPYERAALEGPALSVRFGDVDGDGDVDAVGVSGPLNGLPVGSVMTWFNDGAGFTQSPVREPLDVSSGFQAAGSAVGDLDGNGTDDLVLIRVTGQDSLLSTFLRDATGALGAPITRNLGSGTLAQPIVEDFDGDGLEDVVLLRAPQGDLLLLRSLGTGALQDPLVSTGAQGSLRAEAADFTGDGVLDVATTNAARDEVLVYAGSGAGFTLLSATPLAQWPEDIAAGDLDGDGDVDLVAVERSSAVVSVLMNQGQGAAFTPSTIGSGLIFSAEVEVADADGDGDQDIFLVETDTSVTVFQNDGSAFNALPPSPVGGLAGFALVDLDLNGLPDFAHGSSSGALGVLAGDGAGGFGDGEFNRNSTPLRTMVLADIDGDGLQDAIGAGLSSDDIHVIFGQPGGEFSDTAITRVLTGEPRQIVPADFGGDGDVDLFVTTDSALWLLENQNGLLLAPSQPFAGGAWSFINGIAVGDVNGNGDLEIVASTDLGVYVLAQFFGTFGNGYRISSAGFAGVPTLVDADGDGDLDVSFTDPGINAVSVAWNTGSGAFPVTLSVQFPGPTSNVVWADLDGDLLPEAIAAYRTLGTERGLSVLPNLGGQSLGLPVSLPVELTLSNLRPADLDGDGAVDIVAVVGNDIRLYENDGTGRLRPDGIHAVPGRPKTLGIADLDGDGLLDLAFPDGSESNAGIFVLRRRCP